MTIKNIFLLLLTSFLFMACQTNPTESEIDKKEEAAKPLEWLNIKCNPDLKKNKKIVLVSGDEEYRSEEALPQMAKILASQHGFDCTVLFAQDPDHPGIIDPNFTSNIPGLKALTDADLVFIFTRFRNLPDEQMQHFEKYLSAGKPIIGIRTSTHAFNYKDTTHNYAHWGNYYNSTLTDWKGGFGQNILGVNWHTHHGHHKHQSTRGIFADESNLHPILTGIDNRKIWGSTDVYGAPIPASAEPIVLGQVMNRAGEFDEEDLFFGMKDTDVEVATKNPANEKGGNPNEPMQPIVWSKKYQMTDGKEGIAITSTIGSSTDMMNEELRRLFVNATYHLLEMPVPEKAEVKIIGDYSPSQFNFHTDEYWDEKQLRISDL